MSIDRNHFNPDDIEVMDEAFELALGEAGVSNRTCTLAQFVAEDIIDAARKGERDVARLRRKGVGAVSVLLIGEPQLAVDLAHQNGQDRARE